MSHGLRERPGYGSEETGRAYALGLCQPGPRTQEVTSVDITDLRSGALWRREWRHTDREPFGALLRTTERCRRLGEDLVGDLNRWHERQNKGRGGEWAWRGVSKPPDPE